MNQCFQDGRIRLFGLRAILVFCVFAIGLPLQSEAVRGDEKTVSLEIHFGGKEKKAKRFEEIRWKEKMTVLDAMNTVKGKSPGIRFVYRGKGRTALLTQIDDMKNKGASGLNWIFEVNGKLADRSFGVIQLKANDRVTWRFGKYP